MNNKIIVYLLVIIVAAMLNVGFTSCSSDNDEVDNIDTTPISLTAGKDKIIQGADTITSSNKFVAYSTKSVVHGWHVGEASLVVNGKKTIPIKVTPAYNLYDDPICKWGCNIDYIKNNQRQGVISSKSTNTLLAYEDAGAASILAYTFENGKLKSIAAVVSTNHASQYASYLSERFLMLPYYKGSDTYFIGADALELENANTVVVMQVYSASQLISIYMPASDYTTSSHSARNIKHLKREVVNIAQKLQL